MPTQKADDQALAEARAASREIMAKTRAEPHKRSRRSGPEKNCSEETLILGEQNPATPRYEEPPQNEGPKPARPTAAKSRAEPSKVPEQQSEPAAAKSNAEPPKVPEEQSEPAAAEPNAEPPKVPEEQSGEATGSTEEQSHPTQELVIEENVPEDLEAIQSDMDKVGLSGDLVGDEDIETLLEKELDTMVDGTPMDKLETQNLLEALNLASDGEKEATPAKNGQPAEHNRPVATPQAAAPPSGSEGLRRAASSFQGVEDLLNRSVTQDHLDDSQDRSPRIIRKDNPFYLSCRKDTAFD